MENPPGSPTALLNRGVAAFHAGNREGARNLYVQALLVDPESELGWLWFAAVTDEPGEKRYALDRAVQINPDSIGGMSRKRLLDTAPVVPRELADIAALPLPPELADLEGRSRRVPWLGLPRTGRRIETNPKLMRPRRGVAALKPGAATADGRPRRPWWALALALIALLAALGVMLPQWLETQPERLYIAFSGPLSGPNSRVGTEMANSAQLAIDRANAAGGINGNELALLRYDDESNVDVARQRAEEIVADGRVLLVLGHTSSTVSLAAGEVYRAAGIPAITGSATADAVTQDNPWYFRTVFRNNFQGGLLAAYVANVLGFSRASIVTTPNPYERSLSTAIAVGFQKYGSVKQTWELDPDARETSIQALVEELAADPDPGIVVLTLLQVDAREVLLAMRRAGLSPPLIGGDALGDEEFAALFANEPEEQDQPGFFTNGLYTAAPLLYDAIGGDALNFAQRYLEAYGSSPAWQGAKAYDAATIAIDAIAAAGIAGDDASRGPDRQGIRDALAAIDNPEVARRGLTGPLYFDQHRTVPQAFSAGRYTGGLLTSALHQYRLVVDPTVYDAKSDLASGRAILVGGLLLRQYPVVDVGIDINEIRDLDTAAQSFLADFFLWFRAPDDDEALTDVFFPNATDPTLRLGDPLEENVDPDGTNYRIYRVQGTFTQPLDFHDYPWDRHSLMIGVQNVALQEDEVVYVPSPAILSESQTERLLSGSDLSNPFNNIPNWDATRVDFSSGSTMARSVRSAETTRAPTYVQFSQFLTEITLERDVRSFLLKNLLPLALLSLVTYISLFFSPDQAGTRISFAITSILTAAVLLAGISSQLPDVGYTVAIEWGFYIYIALSAALVFINIAVARLYKEKRYKAVDRLDAVTRTLYPVVGLITFMVYLARFGI